MMKNKWTISLFTLFLIFVYVFLQFIWTTNQLEETVKNLNERTLSDEEPLHFILIAQELDNPYWRKIEQGAQDAADNLQVAVEYVAPFRTSMEEQIKLLEKAIASQVDGIIVQSLDEETFTPIINKAISRNIPIITIDTDAPTSQRISYVGTDNYAAGQLLGETVVKRTTGIRKVGVIIGSDTSENQKARLQGFLSIIEQHPRLEVVDVKVSNISRIQASIQAEIMLKQHPEISVLVGTSALDAIGMSLATKILQRDDIDIFGFDDVEETLIAIKEGKILATVIQKPYEMGYLAVLLMYDYLHGKRIPEIYYTSSEAVDKSSMQMGETP
jgi:ribose transport system substrate-binding protein